jgi:hypothetical protein
MEVRAKGPTIIYVGKEREQKQGENGDERGVNEDPQRKAKKKRQNDRHDRE